MKSISITAAAIVMALLFGAMPGIPARAAGSAPCADSLELNAARNTRTEGVLSARDADGDIVAFEITTDPIKGDITLRDDGGFCYTPRPGKRGRDYFGYRAIDKEGNVSEEATVIIRIGKQ